MLHGVCKFLTPLSIALLLASTPVAAGTCDQEREAFIENGWESFKAAYSVQEASEGARLAAALMGLSVPIYEADMDAFNAFAFPRHIVISKIAAQASKEELYFVLAHEVGHIELGHPLAGLVLLDGCSFFNVRQSPSVLQQQEHSADEFAIKYLKDRGLFSAEAAKSALHQHHDDASSHPSRDARLATLE